MSLFDNYNTEAGRAGVILIWYLLMAMVSKHRYFLCGALC